MPAASARCDSVASGARPVSAYPKMAVSGVRISQYSLSICPAQRALYSYVMLMDSVYKEDGNYTGMWEMFS